LKISNQTWSQDVDHSFLFLILEVGTFINWMNNILDAVSIEKIPEMDEEGKNERMKEIIRLH